MEQQFGLLITAITERKQQLLAQLHTTQNAKTEDAKQSFAALSKQLDLCMTLDSEINAYLTNSPPLSEDAQSVAIGVVLCARIEQLCQQNTMSTNIDSTVIKTSFLKKTKLKLLSLITSFGTLMLDDATKSDEDYQRMPDDETVDVTPRHKKQEPKVSEAQRVWRERQIEHAKQTKEYQKLIELYPKYMSKGWRTIQLKMGFVDIPKVNEKVGKKRWMGKYAKWRRWLHLKTEQAALESKKA